MFTVPKGIAITSRMLLALIISLVIAAWSYVCGMAFISLVFINRTYNSKHWFSSVFCVYCTIYALLLLEVMEFQISGTQTILVGLVVVALILNTVLSPFLSIRSVFSDLGLNTKLSTAAAIIAIGAFLYLCRSLVSVSWEAAVTFNLATGTVCNGILSGFAAVNTPYNYLFPILSQGRIHKANKVVESLMKRQRYLVDNWCSKRRQINVELLEKSGQKAGITLTSLLNSFKGNSNEMECEGMNTVSLSIFLEIDELSVFANKNIDSKLLRLANFTIGIVVTLFGLAKIVSIALGLFVSLNSSGASSSSQLLGSEIAIIVNGVMIMMSLRGFLLAIFRLSTKFTSSLNADTATFLFTSAFGVFALSQFAMSIKFLSGPHQAIVHSAIGEVEPDAFRLWNSLSFILSAVAAFSLRFIWVTTSASD